MASHPSPPPPPENPIPSAPTTISALADDQLREILLLLPDLPSLASAAFTCRAFLGAVRSSRAFRRSFRALHAPPLLALFLTPYMRTEDSESEVTGNILGDVGPEGTEKASSVLITALCSFKEALIKDGEANVAEIDAFLLCVDAEDEKNSLARKITALDELLITVRDRVLRVGADSVFYGQKTGTESWWEMCKGNLRRAFFAS